MLVFVRGSLTDKLDGRGFYEFTTYFRDEWRKFIVREGYHPPSDEHGVHIEKCYRGGEGAGEYICKTQDGKNPGNEMARSDMKTGRR